MTQVTQGALTGSKHIAVYLQSVYLYINSLLNSDAKTYQNALQAYIVMQKLSTRLPFNSAYESISLKFPSKMSDFFSHISKFPD